MFKSLRTVLFASLAGLVFVSFAVFLSVAMPSIRATIISQVSREGLDRASSAAPVFSSMMAQGHNIPALQKKAEEFAKASGNLVTIISRDGIVLADSRMTQKEVLLLDNHLSRPEISAARATGRGVSVRYSATAKKDLIYAAIRLDEGPARVLGYVRFAAPLLYAGEIFSNLYSASLLAFVAAIVAALLLSLLISGWFFKPLDRLSRISNEIVNGRFPKMSLRKPAFEFGQIERSVEQISDRLADYFEKLSGEKGKLAGLLANMREGVLAVDIRGRIMFANRKACDMFGISGRDTAGLTVRTALRNNEVAEAVERVLEFPGQEADIEIELFSPSMAFFSVHAGPLNSDQGEFLGVICVFYDMTKIKELEKYRSEFIANVSHELKTPLTVIRNYVETLLSGGIDDKANNRMFLHKIEQHAINLASLIEDIIELSRLEKEREKKEACPVDIPALAAKCAEALSGKAAAKSIKIETICKACSVQGSREHIYRAMLNLVDNAVKYTENGGVIRIACEDDGQAAKVIVTDSGIGIPKESIPRIFERFYRVDPARSRESGGTGLGLAIVKHIMELHGGNVSVESELGKGSTFTLVFPRQN